jgi:AraC-like DNA-binding protein
LGTFADEADLQTDIHRAGISFSADWFYVVNVLLLRPSELGSPSALGQDTPSTLPYRLFLKQFLAKVFEDAGKSFVLCDIDAGSFVLLLMNGAQTPEELKKTFTDISRRIEENDWVPPTFAISEGGRGLTDLHGLYEQTEEIAEYLTCLDQYGVFHHTSLPTRGDIPQLTVDDEMLFTQLLHSGTSDSKRAAEDLNDFWLRFVNQNISKKSLSADMLVSLRERMRHCLLRALTQHQKNTDSAAGMGLNEELEALLLQAKLVKPLEGIYQCAVQIQSAIGLANSQKRDEDSTQTKAMLVAALEKHYADSQFTLAMLADMCGMAESALYRVWKNFFGSSFSSHLEQYRINKAFELLREQISVKEVAARVGYTSDHSFRRAFKRIMKVPPSQFGSSDE